MRIKMALSVASILVTQNLLLANETTKLDDVQVVTSASGYEQKITDAPASISVITQEDLKKKKYSNLAEAIEDVEGVDVRDGVGKTGGLNISIRGMGSSNTLILIDGRRQNSSGNNTPNGFGETSGNFLPPLASIERIEVIKGPMSTLYGADAMGGVVNIITKKVSNEWTGNINVDQTLQESSQFGNSNNLNMYASGPVVKDLLGLALRGNYYNREASNIKYGDGEFVSARGPSPVEGTNWSLGGKFTLTPNDSNDIYLDTFTSKQKYNNDKSQLGTLPDATKDYGYKEDLRFEKEEITLGHNSRFSIGTLESSIMKTQTETLGRTIPTEATLKLTNLVAGENRELKNEDIVLDTKFTTDILNKNIITVGGQYWNSELKDGLIEAKLKQDLFGLFIEDEISILDSLRLTLGGRYDHHDKFGGHFSPRGYLVWDTTDNWTIKGGVSTGYKAPRVDQLYSGINGVTRQGKDLTYGNSNLNPEESTNYETGVYYNADNGFSANATIFYNDYKDKIESESFVDSGGVNSTRPINIGKAETKGLEFGTNIPIIESLNLKASYTYMESEQKNGKNKGEPFANTPKHSLNATLNWDINAKLSTWLKGEYKSARQVFTEKYENLSVANKARYDQVGAEINAYELFHLGANYKWDKDLTFSATIYNLFDKNLYKHEPYTYTSGTPPKSTTAYADTDANLEGRRLWLAMNLAF